MKKDLSYDNLIINVKDGFVNRVSCFFLLNTSYFNSIYKISNFINDKKLIDSRLGRLLTISANILSFSNTSLLKVIFINEITVEIVFN